MSLTNFYKPLECQRCGRSYRFNHVDLKLIKAIYLQESRDVLLAAVRRGDLPAVRAAIEAEGGRTLVRSHNSFGRTALHIAVLAENEEITSYLAQNSPELLRIGDNVRPCKLFQYHLIKIMRVSAVSPVAKFRQYKSALITKST